MGICDHVGMDEQEIDLPDDVDALKAMVREGLRREARMQHLINQLQHFRFGARSEKLTPDQYALALEDFEVAKAEVDALADLSDDAPRVRGKHASGDLPMPSADRSRDIFQRSKSRFCRLKPNAHAAVVSCTGSMPMRLAAWTSFPSLIVLS